MDIRPWLLIVSILTCGAAHAADERARFDAVYVEYRQHEEDGNWQAALEAAEQSWQIGRRVFGEDNLNTANLALNYGRLLNRFNQGEEAGEVLEPALDIYRDHYGKDGLELVDLYMELGTAARAEARPSLASRHFDRAIDLVPDERVMLRAKLNLNAGAVLQGSKLGRDFTETAWEIYSEQVGKADVRTALAALGLARYEMASGDHDDARPLLEDAIAVFSNAGENSRQFEMVARAFMIKALEELGESDEATKHCRVIGQKAPPDPDEKYLPIYKEMPRFPRRALDRRLSGWAVVEFTVDDAGFTRDHEIVESSDTIFEDAALTSAKSFRYAPRFENGKPVATHGVQNKVTFEVLD
ncbi:MAG: TonB family protein [Pseudomonadales bacterium]|nr:TonB family protein [Pseudomonadales bacterium]